MDTLQHKRLQELQDELKALKLQFGKALHMHKAPAGSPGAPFPIALDVQVTAPAAAGMYDVDALQLQIVLSHGVLAQTPAAEAVAVRVINPALPADLRALVAERLHAAWWQQQQQQQQQQQASQAAAAAAKPAVAQVAGLLGLHSIMATAEQRFVALITALPQHVERYETVDAAGATVRRFAIVDESIGVTAAASSAVTKAPAGDPQSPQQPPPSHPQQQQQQQQQQRRQDGSRAGPDSAGAAATLSGRPVQRRPQRPPGVAGSVGSAQQQSPEQMAAGELAGLARRFGTALQLHAPELQQLPVQTQHAGLQQQQHSQQQQAKHKQQASQQLQQASAEEQLLLQQHEQVHNARGTQQRSLAVPTAALQRFSLSLVPTDPLWGDRGPLQITGALSPASYPSAASLQLSVTASPPGVPPPLAQALQAALSQHVAQQAGQQGLLRGALRHMENYAGELARQQQQRQRQQGQHSQRRGGQQEGGSEGTRQRAPAGGTSSSSEAEHRGAGASDNSDAWHTLGDSSASSSTAASSSSDGEGSESEQEEGAGGADEVRLQGHGLGAPEEAAAAGPPAYAVSLEGLQLDNVAVVEALKASFQVTCSRCGAPATLDLASDAVNVDAPFQASAECSKCHQQLGLQMRPRFVHDTCNQLGTLKPQGCVPLDLLPSMFAGQCAHCSAVCALRGVQVGLPFERACSGCHKPLLLHIRAVAFIPRGAAAATAGRGGARAARGPRAGGRRGAGGAAGKYSSVVLVVGQPLPDMGVCKHYKHSHRWLRFPCCGVRFPCDLCHEELTDGHDVRWANHMVCGFCSVEQAVAPTCAHCKRKLATAARNPTGRHTRFWEGGQGCRDTKMMDSRDAHKHRNSKRKTKSAKASRVGPKPWSGSTKKQQE